MKRTGLLIITIVAVIAAANTFAQAKDYKKELRIHTPQPKAKMALTADTLKIKLKEPLAAIKGYEYGSEPVQMMEFKKVMESVYGNSELELAAETLFADFLEGTASFYGKQYICRELRTIGKEACVKVLAEMLVDTNYTNMARFALESNMTPAAEKALIDALGKTDGKDRAGVINSLGVRRSNAAVKKLGKLMYDEDTMIAEAAITALGKIGSSKAAAKLTKAKKKINDELQANVQRASIECAGQLAKEGDKAAAKKIYDKLNDSDNSWLIRTAAQKGLLGLEPSGRKLNRIVAKVIKALKSSDELTRKVGVAVLSELPESEDITEQIAGAMPKCEPYVQEQVIAVLGNRGGAAALTAVSASVKSEHDFIRLAALKAIGEIGNVSSVPVLLDIAVNGSGDEKKTAVKSLASIKGRDVDEKIIAMVPQADAGTKAILISVIGERYSTGATAMLVGTAKDADKKVRSESLKALGKVAATEDIPVLVELMVNTADEADRNKTEITLADVAKRSTEGKNKLAEKIMSTLPNITDREVKSSLIRTLGSAHTSEAKILLLEKLKDGDREDKLAAISGLARAKAFETLPNLRETAKNDGDLKTHILAIRACVEILQANNNQPREECVTHFSGLLSNARRTEEKKQLLAAMSEWNFRCEYSLTLAEAYMQYRETEREATDAAKRIGENLGYKRELRKHPVYGEYVGTFNSVEGKAIVQAEKHSDRPFNYRVRVVAEGMEAGFIASLREERAKKMTIDSEGWKGQIEGDKLIATRGDDRIEMEYTVRTSPTLGLKPPADAVVLLPFEEGKAPSMENWNNPTWRPLADGSMEVGKGYNLTNREFASCRMHIEFATPYMPHEHGQGRGNSGVYQMGKYETQVLDSFIDNAGTGNCGGIYNTAVPTVEFVTLPPLQWQTYDITFYGPEFDAEGNIVKNARFEKMIHNGIVIHENIDVPKPTGAGIKDDEQVPTAPLALQDHGNPIRYRNIWLQEL